ncbi:MAG: hypothetical protein AAFU68_02815 [Pseudomonadota bacterium]
MSRNPWMKFYPADWRQDAALRLVSLSARGLWVDLLSLMHEASPRGHLLVANRPPTTDDLARLTGAPTDQIIDLLDELRAAGVFSETRSGVIYSRRMVRDERKSLEGRRNVRKRADRAGAQAIEKPSEKDRPTRGACSAPSTKKPEARSQRLKKETPNGVSKKMRCPPDWRPSADAMNWARSQFQNLSAETLNDFTAEFAEYWSAKTTARPGWDLTWKNRLREKAPALLRGQMVACQNGGFNGHGTQNPDIRRDFNGRGGARVSDQGNIARAADRVRAAVRRQQGFGGDTGETIDASYEVVNQDQLGFEGMGHAERGAARR